MTSPTVDALLRSGIERLTASGSETPRLDAELLLAAAIGVDRVAVIAHPEAPVGRDAVATWEVALARRERGEPVAYIRGFKEFFGLAFSTDARALIPRPETERLVELAEAEVMARLTDAPRAPGAPRLRIADVGTGTGAVAIALAVRLRRRAAAEDVSILATDCSPEALDLARENAVGHAVADTVRFAEADLLPPVVDPPFDLVLANLPYVPSADVDDLPVAVSFEPRVAVDGGADGLEVIRALIARLPDVLADEGAILLEIDEDLIEGIRAAAGPDWDLTVEPDLGGEPRVAILRRTVAAGAAPS